MGVTDFAGGVATPAAGNVSNIQGLISGQTNPLTSYLSNLTGLKFLVPAGTGQFQKVAQVVPVHGLQLCRSSVRICLLLMQICKARMPG